MTATEATLGYHVDPNTEQVLELQNQAGLVQQ
jgi:hypothetical protein